MTRVAVIGVGSMGKNHARVYRELSECELVAVCDAKESAADSLGALYGIKAYTDFHKMLDVEKPDAVSIVVPTVNHREVALAAMNAGVDVLIEKPIAATVEEGQELIEEAQRLNRRLMVGHIVRFNPAMQELKRRLEAGELGRVFQIFCRRTGPFPTGRVFDVGVVVDLAPHDVDVMRFLTGLDPLRLYAEIEQRIHTNHEDMLFGLLRFPEGITGALEINWLTPTKVREVLVLGERGLFRVDDLVQDLYFYENSQASGELWGDIRTLKGVSEGVMTRYAVKRYEPLKAELQAFLRAVRGEAPVPITGEDGLAALRLALTLVKSGQEHEIISF